MYGTGWQNLCSLILGIIALALPIIHIMRRKQDEKNTRNILLLTSIAACAASLVLQQSYTNYLVYKNDWAALLDTNHAVTDVSIGLFVVTLGLNALALFLGDHRRTKK